MAGTIDSSEFHKTFSGTDMVASIVFPGTKAITIGELTTISYSVYREKAAVRTFSYINVRGFTKGPRTVAGTMIFTVFDKHIVNRLRAEVPYFTDLVKMKADELPPFDIYITMGNEYGASARLNIYGLTVVDEGQVMSVEDLFTENQWSFMARNIDLQDEIGAEQYIPSTTMNHQEAVPTFKTDSLVLDDDFEAMKKEMDKMKADAKAAVDAARAKAKQAYTAEAAQFAVAQVPTDKFDGWVIAPTTYNVPDGQDLDKNDYSGITDITVEKLTSAALEYDFFDGNDRVVYLNVYAKCNGYAGKCIPDDISFGLGLTDQNGNDLKTQDNGGGSTAPLKQWCAVSTGNDGSQITDASEGSSVVAFKFTIKGYKSCAIPPKIFIKASVTNKTAISGDDGNSYYLAGSNILNVENNQGSGSLNSEAMKFVWLDSASAESQNAISDANISITLSVSGKAREQQGDTLAVALWYWIGPLGGFNLVETDADSHNSGTGDYDTDVPYMSFAVDAEDGSLDSSKRDSIFIEGPVTLYFHTKKDGTITNYSIGGNGSNSNAGTYADQLTSWQNPSFKLSLNQAQANNFVSSLDFIFDVSLDPFYESMLGKCYDGIKKVADSYGAEFLASDMYIEIGPFTCKTDDGTDVTANFNGINKLRICFKEATSVWSEILNLF